MELFKKTNFDFVGRRYVPIGFSAAVMAASVALMATKGLNYGIEFTGGVLIQVGFQKPVDLKDLRSALERGGLSPEIQSTPGRPAYILRERGSEDAVEAVSSRTLSVLRSAFPDNPPTLDRKDYIGPAVGKDLKRRTYWAILFSLLGIVAYVAFRFANPVWGVAGVIALFHDVIGTAGLFALTGKEVDLLIVSAFLTIAGYSINDTIVIFDRMRENLNLLRREPLEEVINRSVNETLSRTAITVLTVQIICLVLLFTGGPVLHDFALAMVVGNILGTYSTVGVAAPLVYEWQLRFGGRRGQAPASGRSAGTGRAENVPRPAPSPTASPKAAAAERDPSRQG